MKVLFLSNSDIKRALPYKKLIPAMKQAMIAKNKKNTIHPNRYVLPLTNNNALGVMPSLVPQTPYFGLKVASIFPENKMMDSHQGVFILLDQKNGSPVAILNASELTARRTAAMSAAATDALARPKASHLAIFGFGIQAKEHISAIQKIRTIKSIKVFTRSPVEKLNLGIPTSYSNSTTEVLNNSDIACLCTSAKTSYLSSEELPPGIHINAIGACRPGQKEIKLREHPNLSVFVDDFKASSIEADEIKNLGESTPIKEIEEVFSTPSKFESSKQSITLFKSVGLSIQDIYAAELAFREANKLKLGVEVSL